MVVQLLVMSAILGASTFAVGMLPLSYAFSKGHLERLAALGTGLLLGAALGVIIPEGIETVVEANPGDVPTERISLSLIIGFILMLIIEQLISPNAHTLDDMPMSLQSKSNGSNLATAASVEFDAELGDLDPVNGRHNSGGDAVVGGGGRERAFTLMLGLVFHGCADGLALGVANLAKTAPGATNTVSFVVFLALILHKAPTSLAFTTSLLSTNLPRPDCKKYLAIFSLSTPVIAIVSYLLFSFFGASDETNLIGTALLISGGTFLYVATVLQPVSHHAPVSGDLRPISRIFFIALGMFIPVTLSSLIGHGH
ncbi:Zinc transporter ZIP9 [Psilocybe cubensis]|uniref:Zinc transporter ZIP9 n=2 Tax=Psilocybe cubensis TaxID=181762 RepID=A0ACB8H091_PSICU|nr:Zinc transporter ZIP9 [Psilocybe cubensis]KAH9480620.1 Zinc transporter ZIP9 [Psilocybe cubensis]